MKDRATNEGKMEAKDLVTDKFVQGEKVDEMMNGIQESDVLGKENKMQRMFGINLQERMQEMKQDILDNVNNQMNDMVSDLMQKLDKLNSKESKDLADSEIYCNRIKPTREDVLPPKQFLRRNSLLTDLYEVKHIRTIYNLMVLTLIFLFIRTAVYDIRLTGSPNVAVSTILRGFSKFQTVVFVWSIMQCSTLAVYAAFCYWAKVRLQLLPKSFARKVWDYGWVAITIAYQFTFIALSMKAVIREQLPVASSLIILMEQTRLVMKTHAFVRSVAPRILSYKPHSETPVPKPPGFSKYLYFLFAPTLIYQDDYPRTTTIRWNAVLSNFTEVLAIIFLTAILYERGIEPNFRDFGKGPVDFLMICLGLLETIMAGTMLFVSGFYLLLHAWMNTFAELLRFADRMFYKDWWNSNNYSAYYRTWNIVVHDWLYTYVYKDIYEILVPRNKILATTVVFTLSAIIHEYILCVAFGFFFPFMLFMFGGLGGVVFFPFKKSCNIFLWFTLCSGSGSLAAMYTMEHFARINCDPVFDGFLDLVVPRISACLLRE